MNWTDDHIHHMARRTHQATSKLRALQDKFAGITTRFISTLEVSGGAFLGGVVEGRTDGGTVLHVPINLAAGAALLAAGHLELAGEDLSEHLNNVGNGLVAGYVASKGYAFGKRWHDTGKLFPGKDTAALPAPTVQGEVNQATMDAILARMHQAAAQGAPAAP